MKMRHEKPKGKEKNIGRGEVGGEEWRERRK